MTLNARELKAVSGIAKGLNPRVVGESVGVSERTIWRWQLKPEFKEAVQKLLSKTESRVFESTVEKSSQGIIAELEDLRSQHLASYGRLRKLAEKLLEKYEKQVEESPEDLNLKSLSILFQILDRSVRGEAESAFMKYLDLDTGINSVIAAGFVVVDPREESEIQSEPSTTLQY